MRVIGIIPARWGSTRLPGKPLADIGGRPLIEHVWRRARRARRLSRLVVATDDQRIVEVVRGFGGEAVMTSRACASGTDRLAEAAARQACDLVVNIQGDEPFLRPADLDRLVEPFLTDRTLTMATLAAPLPPEALTDPNSVKVVCNRGGEALYFSRAPIPFAREARRQAGAGPWLHLGVYAYRKKFLLQFARWPHTPLEKTEKLEQLRALEHGCAIRVIRVARPSLSVDTPADLAAARRAIRRGA